MTVPFSGLTVLAAMLVSVSFPARAADGFDLALSDIVPSLSVIDGGSEEVPIIPPPAAPLADSPLPVQPAGTPPVGRITTHPRHRRHLVGGMTTTSWVLTGLFAVGGTAVLARGSNDDAERLGDALQIFLPTSAYAMTWIGRDGRGAGQYSLQLGTGLALTYGLKQVVSKRTPTADAFDSFPSAHTQAAFSGASFIHRRFGPRWGVPAFVLASYTGLSRVKADRHYLDDVIAGMSIALVGGWTFTHPIEDRVSLNPLLVNGGFGVGLTVTDGGSGSGETQQAKDRSRRWTYTWEVGRVTVHHNIAQVPAGAGDQVDFRFRERNNPAATSNLQIDRSLSPHHQVSARLAPFEVREEEHYTSPVTFGGETFGLTETLDTRYVGYDLRLRWRYRIFPDRFVQVHTGAGLEVVSTRARIAVRNRPEGQPAKIGSGSDFHLLPVIHLHIGLAPGRFHLYGETDGTEVGSERFLDWTAGLRFSIDHSWEIGIAHRWVEWSLDSSDIRNRFESGTSNLTIGYHW